MSTQAANIKLRAFTEMIADDIEDALNLDLDPVELMTALLVYASTVAIMQTDLGGDDFLEFAVGAWNDRISKLVDVEDQELLEVVNDDPKD